KFEAFDAFKRYKKMVEESSGYKIKTLRTDREGEFTSKDFASFCEESGIKRHMTTPYSPQQNGVVERQNRTIMEMARSLLKSLPDITPYEAWFGKKPSLEHLKVFGCVVFARSIGVHIRKLDDRGKKMVYFGVEDGTKGNRLYDPQDMKLRVSHDVVFDEKEEDVMSDSTPINIALDPFSSSSTHTTSPSSEFGPRGFHSLDGIYDGTEIVTLEPEELMMMETDQPTTFKEAVSMKEWREAMQAELESIEKNKTWKLTDLPPGHRAIGLKWVYKVKRDNMGNVVKYKARLVAKGFIQKKGVDFDEVFAPVARLDTVRLILSLAAQNGWVVHHLDVKSAFLNGDLKEEVYVTQPEGYVNKNESQKVFKLSKALYGL
ncbi:zinc finger, CCHC-type containing protein, partial [Tanacetum coccineum]